MVCVWIEGYETHIGTTQLTRKYASFSGTMGSQSGRVHGVAGGVSTANVSVTPSFGTDNTFVLGIGLKLTTHRSTLNSGNQGWYVETGADEQCHIEIESASGTGFRFLIKRGATTIATSSYYDFGVWHYFEFKFTVRTGTNGAYELRHNGVLDVSGTSVNMADDATDGWDVFAQRFSSAGNQLLHVDDLYILNGTGSVNNDFLGPSIVEGLLPNADGTTTTWTQNGAGDHYTSVDDSSSTTDDTGTGGTIGSDTNGNKDTFDFEDLTEITGNIHAVQLGTQMAMASAGTRTVKTKYRDPDTTEVDGASHVVDSTTYDEFTEVFDTNPNGSTAWDVADIDNGEFGVEVVS